MSMSNSHAQAFSLLDMTIQILWKLPTGEHFVALFGTNHSMLEALLLKRKVMGPSWLALQKPIRVATQSQVYQRCTRGFPSLMIERVECRTCTQSE